MKILVIILCCLISSGCTVLSNEVNKNWPPLTTKQQQLQAINESNENRITQADAMLFLSSEDFIKLTKEASNIYLKKISGKNIGNTSIEEINIINISPVKQGALISGAFKLNLLKYNIKISGEITGIAAVAAQDNQIKIFPAFSHIKLNAISLSDEIKLLKNFGNAAAINFTTNVLNEFVGNINGSIAKDPIIIPIDLIFSKNINPENLTKSIIPAPSINKELNVTVSMNSYLPLIDEQGIIFLATNKKENRKPIHNNSGDLNSVFSDYSEYVTHITSTQLDVNLDQLRNTTFLVNKKYFSTIFNKATEGLAIEFKKSDFIEIPENDRKFNQPVEFHKPDRLPSCHGLYTDCATCTQDSCSGPCRTDNCEDCTPRRFPYVPNPLCLARSAACQAENAARIAGCTICRTTAISEKAICDAGVVACRVLREAKVAECKALREGTKIINDLKNLANLDGEFSVKNSNLHATASQLKFNDDLSKFSIVGDIHASADTWLKVHVTPNALGHIACLFPFQKTLETYASASINDKNFTASIKTIANINNSITLKAVTDPVIAQVNLMPPPYFQLIQDPLFILNCSFLTMAMPTIAGVELLAKKDVPDALKLMFGELQINIESKEFDIEIKPVSIGIGDNKLILKPTINPKTIGFEL